VRRLVLVTFVSLVAFSGFEATFSLLAEARFNLSESSTYGLFFLVGIGLVIVQGGAIHTVVVKLGEVRTLRLGLACNAIGLSLVAVDAGWAPLTLALALLIVGQGLVAPTLSALVAGGAAVARCSVSSSRPAASLVRLARPSPGICLASRSRRRTSLARRWSRSLSFLLPTGNLWCRIAVPARARPQR
jgi:hypothetical protein